MLNIQTTKKWTYKKYEYINKQMQFHERSIELTFLFIICLPLSFWKPLDSRARATAFELSSGRELGTKGVADERPGKKGGKTKKEICGSATE